jgi:hypothetical protein
MDKVGSWRSDVMRAVAVGILLTFFPISVNAQQKQIPPLKTITADQYLKMPENYQVMYLAGVIDATSFSLYGSDDPNFATWAKCVRKKTLGEFQKELLDYLEKNPAERSEPLPWPISKLIGARRPCD